MCIRDRHNSHVAELYTKVGVGTKVTATYKSYRTASLSPVKYSYSAAKPRKRRVIRRVVRNGRTEYRTTYRAVQRKPQPKLLDWLLGS